MLKGPPPPLSLSGIRVVAICNSKEEEEEKKREESRKGKKNKRGVLPCPRGFGSKSDEIHNLPKLLVARAIMGPGVALGLASFLFKF